MGAPPEVIEAMRKQAKPEDFAVDPDNWDTLTAWLRVQTQWRVGMSGPVGLDYVAVDVVLRRLGLGGDVFDGLQIMERAALQELTKD